MKNIDLVSRIAGSLKSVTKDGRISRRLILKTAQQKAEFYISQKLNDRSLYREDNIYTVLDCFELEPIETISCSIIEFRLCKTLMRSKVKVPNLIYSRYGSSIKEVTSVDGQYVFTATTPSKYRRDKNRAIKSNNLSFYIKDGYLYIPDSEVRVVNLVLISSDLYDVQECSTCSDKCKSIWDYDFICPTKLTEIVIQETYKELLTMKQITPNINPNLNEAD